MIRNLLWDADSALFDTLPAMTYAMSRGLRELGYSLPLNRINALLRHSPEYCVNALSHRFKLNPHLLMEQYAAIYGTVHPVNQSPFAGMPALAAWIFERGGVNIALTTGNHETVVEGLKVHRLDRFFENVLSLNEVTDLDKVFLITTQEKLFAWATENDFQIAYLGEKKISPVDISFTNYQDLLEQLCSK